MALDRCGWLYGSFADFPDFDSELAKCAYYVWCGYCANGPKVPGRTRRSDHVKLNWDDCCYLYHGKFGCDNLKTDWRWLFCR